MKKGKLRAVVLEIVTGLSVLLMYYGVAITACDEWDWTWIPVQLTMIIVGGGWFHCMALANGWYYDPDEDEEDDERDI